MGQSKCSALSQLFSCPITLTEMLDRTIPLGAQLPNTATSKEVVALFVVPVFGSWHTPKTRTGKQNAAEGEVDMQDLPWATQ